MPRAARTAVPDGDPTELGRHHGWVMAVAVLPNGRVVTGGADGRVLVWDPSVPGGGPAELGDHDSAVRAVAALPEGLVVSAGDDRRVLLWDPGRPGTRVVQLGCPVTEVATAPFSAALSWLVIAHDDMGFSTWSVMT